jgi:hypothetical protein
MCVSTSLMPTPGPPLRERVGIIRRGRDAAAVPAAVASEGASVEGPACEAAAGSVLDGPPVPPPLADVDAAGAEAEIVVVIEVVGTAAAAAVAVSDTLAVAGSAVAADARLGMVPRRVRDTDTGRVLLFFGGRCPKGRG